jgi:F-type H+-transporting ATPase subunit gamma
MAGLKDLRTRIKSIGNTRKITRAMQLVSAAKMRKSQSAVLASRAYSELAWSLINEIAHKYHVDNPLLKRFSSSKKNLVILFSTNKGLVGNLNSNLFLRIREIEEKFPGEEINMVVYGKKAAKFAKRIKKNLLADFEKNDRELEMKDVYALSKHVVNLYESGEYRRVFLFYNHFHSTLSQKSEVVKLLPFRDDLISTAIHTADDKAMFDVFEPSPQRVFEELLPKIIESKIYQSILESNASEHSARMIMMKNATDAAGDLVDDLSLAANQLRQNKITTELSEITAGRLALQK